MGNDKIIGRKKDDIVGRKKGNILGSTSFKIKKSIQGLNRLRQVVLAQAKFTQEIKKFRGKPKEVSGGIPLTETIQVPVSENRKIVNKLKKRFPLVKDSDFASNLIF